VQKFDLDAVPVVTITVTGYQSLKELTELAPAPEGTARIG